MNNYDFASKRAFNRSIEFSDIDLHIDFDTEHAVVEARCRKRRYSITCDCNKTAEDNVTSDVVQDLLQVLKSDDILALSGRNLEEGIGSPRIKIRKVEEIDPETRPSSFLFDSPSEYNRSMLSCIQQVQRTIESRKNDLLPSGLVKSQIKYLEALQMRIEEIDHSMKAPMLQHRIDGAQVITELRKKLTFSLFRKVIRPKVEDLMIRYGEYRTFDEAVIILGYNRLFTRPIASAGTDIDFLLVIETDILDLVTEIRSFIKEQIAPELKLIGITIETEDYLVIDWASYSKKLDDTRLSLFTMANMFNPLREKDNAVFITGSQRMFLNQVLHFDNQRLVKHYCNLVGDASEHTQLKLDKLCQWIGGSRVSLIDNLQRMASSEIYIGKNPYSNKKTIQTIMATPGLSEERRKRTIPFPVKYCLSRFADLINSTTYKSTDENVILNSIDIIEKLGLVLSNIVCYQSTQNEVTVCVQELYADISWFQIERMSFCDRVLVCDLMSKLGVEVNPCESHFGNACYDGLWSLADHLLIVAQQIERDIFQKARDLI